MAKGVVADPSIDAVRSDRPGSSNLTSVYSIPSSRTSVLASVVPMFRRQVEDVQKTPLLTLKLSSSSFLDSTVTDNVTEQPLYTIKTIGPTTTIKRADPWDGDTKTAEIRWSKIIPQKGKNTVDGVVIQMRGIWQNSETFLKRGTISSGRKFSIPNYPESLKWKRQGSTYSCTTTAVKGPIATLDLLDDHPQFQIFETLHDKNDARPMRVHHGVSTILLDYMLVTALFLVTDLQAWTQFQVVDISPLTRDVTDLHGLTTPKSAPSNFSTSTQQWRKVMYGEPMYPRSFSDSSYSSRSSSMEALTPPSSIPSEPIAKVEYGHSIYQNRRSSSLAPSTSESESVSEHVYISSTTTQTHSPVSESIFSPVSRGAAPAHTYLDPSFYNDNESVPPVPPIPTHFNNTDSEANHSPHLRPASSHLTRSPSARRLPDIPVLPPVLPLIPRPRSTPPRPRTSPSVNSEAASGSSVPLVPVPDLSAVLRRPRQLPRPPQVPTIALQPDSRQPPIIRARTRSVSHSHEREKWRPQPLYSQRTLPTPPTSSSQGNVRETPLHLQGNVTEDGQYVMIYKEVAGNLRHWAEDAVPGTAYEIPPPAYNSIIFSPKFSNSPLQGPASPLP